MIIVTPFLTVILCLMFIVSNAAPVLGVCSPSVNPCPAGCWNRNGLVSSSGLRECIDVGAGFFSPPFDNLRYRCDFGTYSNIQDAAICDSCPPGSYGDNIGSTECRVCPPGTYSNIPRATYCNTCDSSHYDGEGATSVYVSGRDVFCLPPPTLAPSPTPASGKDQTPHPVSQPAPSMHPDTIAPSEIPTSMPTPAPTSTLTEIVVQAHLAGHGDKSDNDENDGQEETDGPAASNQATAQPTESSAPTTTPELDAGIGSSPLGSEVFQCGVDFYNIHGTCRECPATSTVAIRSVGLLAYLLFVVWYFATNDPSSTAIFFVTTEYLRLMFLAGMVHMEWSSPLAWAFEFLSIFAVDIGIIAPIQCLGNIDPRTELTIALGLPVMLFVLPWCILRFMYVIGRLDNRTWRKHRNMVRHVAGFVTFLAFEKIVLTSMELIGCSSVHSSIFDSRDGVDWFCRRSDDFLGGLASVLGVIGFLFFGVVFPFAFTYRLWLSKDYAQDEAMGSRSSITDFPYHPPPPPSLHALVYVRPFQEQRWWWIGYLLLRKLLIAVAFFVQQQRPLLVFLFLMVQTIMSDFFQRSRDPFRRRPSKTQHMRDDHARRCESSIFQVHTVDVLLKVCLIYASTIGVLAKLMNRDNEEHADDDDDDDTTTIPSMEILSTLVLLILGPSFLYCIIVLLLSIKAKVASHAHKNGRGDGAVGDTSSGGDIDNSTSLGCIPGSSDRSDLSHVHSCEPDIETNHEHHQYEQHHYGSPNVLMGQADHARIGDEDFGKAAETHGIAPTKDVILSIHPDMGGHPWTPEGKENPDGNTVGDGAIHSPSTNLVCTEDQTDVSPTFGVDGGARNHHQDHNHSNGGNHAAGDVQHFEPEVKHHRAHRDDADFANHTHDANDAVADDEDEIDPEDWMPEDYDEYSSEEDLDIPEEVSFETQTTANHGNTTLDIPCIPSIHSMGSTIESFPAGTYSAWIHAAKDAGDKVDGHAASARDDRDDVAEATYNVKEANTNTNTNDNNDGDDLGDGEDDHMWDTGSIDDWKLAMAESGSFFFDCNNATILEPKDRIEPSTWGKRHSR